MNNVTQRQVGRKRDLSRNASILQATLEILAEIGYERMTTDMVAARVKASKATLYRRWPSKAELVIEAVGLLGDDVDDSPPDTGSLVGDLAAVRIAKGDHPSARDLRIMAGLLSMLPHDTELAGAVQRSVVEPRTEMMRTLLLRAQTRGEVSADRDIDTLASVVLAMSTYRLVLTGEPVDDAFMTTVLTEVLVPASLAHRTVHLR